MKFNTHLYWLKWKFDKDIDCKLINKRFEFSDSSPIMLREKPCVVIFQTMY